MRNAIVLFGDAGYILLPFGTYARNVLKAKTAAVVYPQGDGHHEAALVIASASGKQDLGQGRRLHAGSERPDRADCRRSDDGGLRRPVRLGGGREPGERPLRQLGITDSRKIMTAPLCLSPQVSAALGDWPL